MEALVVVKEALVVKVKGRRGQLPVRQDHWLPQGHMMTLSPG